jgi:hypothetical protein
VLRPVKMSRAGAKRRPIEADPFRPTCLVLGARGKREIDAPNV